MDQELFAQTWRVVIVATAHPVSQETPGQRAVRIMTSAVARHAEGTLCAAMTWVASSANVHRDSLGILWSTVKVSCGSNLNVERIGYNNILIELYKDINTIDYPLPFVCINQLPITPIDQQTPPTTL